jgi:hypothetical protein
MKSNTWWWCCVLFPWLSFTPSSWIFYLQGSFPATGTVHPWIVDSFVAPWGKDNIQQEHDWFHRIGKQVTWVMGHSSTGWLISQQGHCSWHSLNVCPISPQFLQAYSLISASPLGSLLPWLFCGRLLLVLAIIRDIICIIWEWSFSTCCILGGNFCYHGWPYLGSLVESFHYVLLPFIALLSPSEGLLWLLWHWWCIYLCLGQGHR